MEDVQVHAFKIDPWAHRQVCECGKGLLDPVHRPEVRLVQGTATPTVVRK